MGQKISETELKEEIRSVVRQNIKEVTTNDWHFKAIMSIWDKGGSFTRKKIGAVLCGDPKADRRDVEEALRDSDYSEVTDVTDRLRIEGVIKEGEDNIPGGLAKGMTLNDIAEKHGVSVDVLVAEFKKGIQTEMEHTTDREMAKEITLDHLFEDPKYYTKLATVEEYVDDKGVEHVAAALPQTEEEPLKEGIKVGSIIIPYAMDKYGEFVVDKVFKNKDGETSYTGKFKNNGEKREFILHSKDKIVKEEYEESPEETLKGLKEMAMGNLERIADYANMISQRMGEGQNLESWMYSQLTIALENLNSVHDAMDGGDGEKEPVKEGYTVRGNNPYQFIQGAYAVLSAYLRDERMGSKEERMLKDVISSLEYLAKYFHSKRNESIEEENPGLWANIRAKRARGEKPAHPNSDAYKKAVKAGKEINNESVGCGCNENHSCGCGGHSVKSVNEGLKHLIHVESPKEIVSKDVAKQIIILAKKGVRSNEIGLNMHFVGDEKAAVNAFQKVKNKIYFDLDKNESINELTQNEKRIKEGNPNNVFYVFYKGKFEAVYWAMNSSDLFKIYWDEFKVRRPAGSQFKLNPEFIIVSKKEYDTSTSNRYAKLKPYVDKFWDKLQNESINEGTEADIISQIKDIAKNHQNNTLVDPKTGKKMRVDAFSASAIATVYDALSDSNKEKFLQSGLLGMQQMAMKLLKR